MSAPARTRSSTLGPGARPVAIPEDIDAPGVQKVTGVVRLPLHLRWSGPDRAYDLAKRTDRARLYEIVLAEGDVDAVRRYVVLGDLIDLWPELVLPRHVRREWSRWLADQRGVAVEC